MANKSSTKGKLKLSTKPHPLQNIAEVDTQASLPNGLLETDASSSSTPMIESTQDQPSGPKPVDPATIIAKNAALKGKSWAALLGGSEKQKRKASPCPSSVVSVAGDSVSGSTPSLSSSGSPSCGSAKQATSPAAQVFVSPEIAQIAKYLEGKTHLGTMRYCLGLEDFPDAPPLTDRIMVVCFDTEGWTADSAKITEIGFNTFDTRDTRAVKPGPHGENFLKHVYFYHIRVQPNAHLLNIKYCPGDPTANRFGQTRFLTTSETQECLNHAFGWPLEHGKPERGICPLILLGHALGGDLDKLQNTIGWNPQNLGNIVKILDTQQIIRDVGWWNKRDQIGLPAIVARCDFTYRNAHTASNDAAMTTISAIKMALPGAKAWVSSDEKGKPIQQVIDEVEARSQNHTWTFGSPKFCLRCGSRTHMQEDLDYQGRPCRVPVRCNHCEEAGRHTASFSHVTERCIQYALAHGNSALAKKSSEEKRAKKAKYMRRFSEQGTGRPAAKGADLTNTPRVVSAPPPMPYAPGGIFGPPTDTEDFKAMYSFATNTASPFGKKAGPFEKGGPFGRKDNAQNNQDTEPASSPTNVKDNSASSEENVCKGNEVAKEDVVSHP